MVWDAWPSTLTATVTNPPAVDDFAVKVIVAYQTGMRSDFADLRFSKDGSALSHTIWAYSVSDEAEVWVKVPNGTQTNAMQHLTPESVFWQLQPGENIVTFSTPSGSVVVSIEYASRYTGV